MIKGLHFVRKREVGKPTVYYVYAWRGGPRIARIVSEVRPRLSTSQIKSAIEAIESRAHRNSYALKALIRDWEQSPEWATLAESTKKTWGSQLKRIEAQWGELPLSIWNDPRMKAKVVAWRDTRAATPRGADLGVTALRELLKFGLLRGRVVRNVADAIPTLYRGGKRAEIIWTESDIEKFAKEALRQEKLHVLDGLRLCALTGLRRADLVTVRFEDVKELAIIKRAMKVSRGKRRTATMPRIPQLDIFLDELSTRDRAMGVDTLLVNSRGQSWSSDGFGGSFNRIRDAANIHHVDQDNGNTRLKHLHDVRGTFATRLIEAELSDAEVAEVMGWSIEQVSGIRRTYVDQSSVIMAIGDRLRRKV